MRSMVGKWFNANEQHILDWYHIAREGHRISTAQVESTVDQLVDWRMEKKQQIRWTKRGAQMLLHARCALLNGDLSKYSGWPPFRIIADAGCGGMNPSFFPVPI